MKSLRFHRAIATSPHRLSCTHPLIRASHPPRTATATIISASYSTNDRPRASNTTPSSSPIPPTSPTQLHHDLPSFLTHAARTALSPTSTTYVGTHYEYTVQAALSRLGLLLSRTGGPQDRGVDLAGWWALPVDAEIRSLRTDDESRPATPARRVVVQCKCLAGKPTPAMVRELEGAAARSSGAGAGAGVGAGAGAGVTMALLAATNASTKGVRRALAEARVPMGFAQVELGGRVRQVLWNRAAEGWGLDGVAVGVRWSDAGADTGMEEEVELGWKGEAWDFEDVQGLWRVMREVYGIGRE